MDDKYMGFETGPIRPPSEHKSLLLRLTRNCPWNRCRFCTLYKGETFSIRNKQDVFADIDAIRLCVDTFDALRTCPEQERAALSQALLQQLGDNAEEVYYAALAWYRTGMTSVFLQDANTMLVKPEDLVAILVYLRQLFPMVQRVTSYGRSHTIARISDENMRRIADAGLNRIHIGMESGSDQVLKLVDKGADKAAHITAGVKVKAVGIELSEYYMPGLGGQEYWQENALESADVLNHINPDFVRIRTLSIPKRALLYGDYENGIFTRMNDTEVVLELLLFVESLKGITSIIKSDHILNLIPEVDGKLPEDRDKLVGAMGWYLNLSEEDQLLFRVGRRTGLINSAAEFERGAMRDRARQICRENNITQENADKIIGKLMNRFI